MASYCKFGHCVSNYIFAIDKGVCCKKVKWWINRHKYANGCIK